MIFNSLVPMGSKSKITAEARAIILRDAKEAVEIIVNSPEGKKFIGAANKYRKAKGENPLKAIDKSRNIGKGEVAGYNIFENAKLPNKKNVFTEHLKAKVFKTLGKDTDDAIKLILDRNKRRQEQNIFIDGILKKGNLKPEMEKKLKRILHENAMWDREVRNTFSTPNALKQGRSHTPVELQRIYDIEMELQNTFNEAEDIMRKMRTVLVNVGN